MNINGVGAILKTRIANFKEDSNCTDLDEFMTEKEFPSFMKQILKTSNTMSQR